MASRPSPKPGPSTDSTPECRWPLPAAGWSRRRRRWPASRCGWPAASSRPGEALSPVERPEEVAMSQMLGNQRWLRGLDSYRPPDEPIRTAEYDVAELPDDTE